jgi:nucleoside 2-deoxyribosyltransferase
MRDEYDVRRADALLVNFEGAKSVSIGSCLEIGLARALNKPTVVVIPAPGSDESVNPHQHPMLEEFASTVVTTLDALLPRSTGLLPAISLPQGALVMQQSTATSANRSPMNLS